MYKLEAYIMEYFQRLFSNIQDNLQLLLGVIRQRQQIKKPLIILGPSGVGKDTMIKKLMKKYPKLFYKLPSYTTRSIREGEKEGIDFYFISKEEFIRKKNENKLFGIQEYNNNFYATDKNIIKEAITKYDKILLLNYNIETVNRIKNKDDFNYIALLPTCEDELEKRLIKKNIKPDEINKRMNLCINEIKLINESNYINYRVVNDDENECFKKLERNIKALYPQYFVDSV